MNMLDQLDSYDSTKSMFESKSDSELENILQMDVSDISTLERRAAQSVLRRRGYSPEQINHLID